MIGAVKPTVFVLDVDGVMTTGQFLYSADGKTHKVFGPHDNEGIKLLKGLLPVRFITADKRGFGITKRRIVDDMGCPLDLVPEAEREAFIAGLGDRVAFMGDGYSDARCMRRVLFAVAPANARKEAREAAHFVTESRSGEGAVLDACLEIIRRFFPERDV